MCDIRENLRAIITNNGYKQAVIAQKAQLTPAKLSGILNKSRRLEAGEMFLLCNALGITPEELLHYQTAN